MTEQTACSVEELTFTVRQLAESQLLDSEITAVLGPLVKQVACRSNYLRRLFERHGWDPDGQCFNSPVDVKHLLADLKKYSGEHQLARFHELTDEWLNYV